MDARPGRAAPSQSYPLPRDRDISSRDYCTLIPASGEMPAQGLPDPLVRSVDEANKSLPDATAIPATPSTVCGSMCSTVTPATSSGLASSAWSQSSGGRTPQESPAFSTSSTATELEEGSTQIEPNVEEEMDGSLSNSVEDKGDNLEENSDGAGGAAEHEPGAQEGTSLRTRGAKRLREQTPRTHQHGQHGSGAKCAPSEHGTDEALLQAVVANDLNSPRPKKECLERSQYPRLSGQPTPAAGPRSYRSQLSPSVADEELVRGVRGDTRGCMFDGVMECTETVCTRPVQQVCDERAGVGMAGEGINGGALKGSSTENLLIEEDIDTSRVGVRVDSPNMSEQSDGEEMDFDGAERERSSTCDNHGEALSRPEHDSPGKIPGWLGGDGHSWQPRSEELLPAVTRGSREGSSSEESTDKLMVVDARMEEAAALRQAGVAGDEEFKELFAKLKCHLKWRWGKGTHSLSNDFWIYKGGAKAKTAKLGVDKFATKDSVVQYVRGLLGLADVAACNGDEHSEEEQDQGTGGDSVEIGDVDKRDEEDTGEKEETGTASHQRGSLVSTPKGRVLQEALEALNPSNAPDVLQQRTTEFNQVLRFVTNSVSKASGGSLYLCGVPGTGKTQTMAHVQAKIHEKYSKGNTPAPAFHSFTGTEFTTPDAMHGALWLAVTGGNDIEEGIDVEKKLSNKLKYRQKTPTATSPMLVVVLDEIDQLMTQNRQVLRKLFEWADAPKSRLVLVGLANSLDFDVNFSDLKKAPQRLLFQSYTPEDLASILTERVGLTVHHSAIQFCAKKAAATTGDARRAINICREAVVLAAQELQEKLDNAASEEERKQQGQGEGSVVTIKHMARAVAAGNAAKYAGAIAGLSFHAKIVLSVAAAAVGGASDHRGGGGANTWKCVRLTQGDLQEKCMGAWRRLQTGEGPSQVEFTGIIDLLAASGLLALKSKQQTGGRARELVLRIEFADLEAALGNQPFFKTVTGI